VALSPSRALSRTIARAPRPTLPPLALGVCAKIAPRVVSAHVSPTPAVPRAVKEDQPTEVIDEVRNALASLQTGEWRRAVNRRLAVLEGAVKAWDAADPPLGERSRVAGEALDLLSELNTRQ
jgi:hypothetical protein